MVEQNFDEMRNQIAILKGKLDKQEIVNDHLMRETMKMKVGKISISTYRSLACAVLCLVMYPILGYTGVFSIPLVIFTCVMMAFCVVASLWTYLPVMNTNLMSADLATVAGVMARFKRLSELWLHFVTPSLLAIWLPWTCYDYTSQMGVDGMNRIYLCVPLLVGSAVGSVIGYIWHRKAVNAAQDIIRQIEE